MVTKISSSDVIKKAKIMGTKSVDGLKKASTVKARSPRRTSATKPAVEEVNYTEHADTPSSPRSRQSTASKVRISKMVARGKDLVSGDATSTATAVAIVVGAALIEVELIPGLVIGAGAILLSKLFPEMGDYVRPAMKSALRAGFVMAQKAQALIAETSEQAHDLVAEVMHEQQHPPSGKKTQPAPEFSAPQAPKA